MVENKLTLKGPLGVAKKFKPLNNVVQFSCYGILKLKWMLQSQEKQTLGTVSSHFNNLVCSSQKILHTLNPIASIILFCLFWTLWCLIN